MPETEAAGTPAGRRGAVGRTAASATDGGRVDADGAGADRSYPGATGTGTDAAAGGGADAPYRAEAVRGDGRQWHLNVRSHDDHPDRGEVDAVVVTVAPERPDDGFPAAEIDRTLAQCGFSRDGDWTPDGARWTAPYRQPHTRAAPPAPPVPAPSETE